jgi:hypothetical protein
MARKRPAVRRSIVKATPRSEANRHSGAAAHDTPRGTINLSCDLGTVFNDPEDSDFRLLVSGTTFHVHRLILKHRSNMFASMFRGGYQETVNGELVIDDFPAADVEAALRWMYADVVEITAANLVEILRVASYMQLDGLVERCTAAATDLVTVKTMVPMLDGAVSQRDTTLQKLCLDLWAHNSSEVLCQPEFLTLSVDALAALLGHGAANCAEDALFKSTAEWLQANGYKNPGSQELYEQTTHAVVEHLLSLIHFDQLSPACLMDAVLLANTMLPGLPGALVAALHCHGTQQVTPKIDGIHIKCPRTGAGIVSGRERHVIEALTSTALARSSEAYELSPVAMQHGINLMMASTAYNKGRGKLRIVPATWEMEPMGSLGLRTDDADLVLFPFLYCGTWRLFTVDCRDSTQTVYATRLNEYLDLSNEDEDSVSDADWDESDDDEDSSVDNDSNVDTLSGDDLRRSYECIGAFHRALERTLGTGVKTNTAQRSCKPVVNDLRLYPHFKVPCVEYPRSGMSVLKTLANMFGKEVPARHRIRDRILGGATPQSDSAASLRLETHVNRAVHSLLTDTNCRTLPASLSRVEDACGSRGVKMVTRVLSRPRSFSSRS